MHTQGSASENEAGGGGGGLQTGKKRRLREWHKAGLKTVLSRGESIMALSSFILKSSCQLFLLLLFMVCVSHTVSDVCESWCLNCFLRSDDC